MAFPYLAPNASLSAKKLQFLPQNVLQAHSWRRGARLRVGSPGFQPWLCYVILGKCLPPTPCPWLQCPTYKGRIGFDVSTGPSFSESDLLVLHWSWLQTTSMLDEPSSQAETISFSRLYASTQVITPSKGCISPSKFPSLLPKQESNFLCLRVFL